MNKTTLCLVRHGQTKSNRRNLNQGWNDAGLNDVGRMQIEQLSQILVQKKWDCVISSDLERAKESAQILAQKLKIPLLLSQELRERGHGLLEGKQVAELRKEHPEINFTSSIPGRETLRSFISRSKKIFEDIAKLMEGKKVIIVSHGGLLKNILHHNFSRTFASRQNAEQKTIYRNKGEWARDNDQAGVRCD